MKSVFGNVIDIACNIYDDHEYTIIHGCNCFHAMGAGVAKQIKEYFPIAYEADKATSHGNPEKLGTISYAVDKERRVTIINAYTQFRYGRGGRHLNYEAVYKAFDEIAYRFQDDTHERRIIYPLIGAGLAGGEWDIISSIIDNRLVGFNHTLVKYQP